MLGYRVWATFLAVYTLTFEELDGGAYDGDGVLGDERVLAKRLGVNDAKAQTTFHDHHSTRPLL